MTFKNADAKKLLDALEILRGVLSVDVSLEKQSIAHKIQALLSRERPASLKGIPLIVEMDDDELAWAIFQKEDRVGMGQFIDPSLFNYLRRERPRALFMAEELRRSNSRFTK